MTKSTEKGTKTGARACPKYPNAAFANAVYPNARIFPDITQLNNS